MEQHSLRSIACKYICSVFSRCVGHFKAQDVGTEFLKNRNGREHEPILVDTLEALPLVGSWRLALRHCRVLMSDGSILLGLWRNIIVKSLQELYASKHKYLVTYLTQDLLALQARYCIPCRKKCICPYE